MNLPNNRNALGWITAFVTFIVQLITAVWIVAKMDAAILELKENMKDVQSVMKIHTTQIQNNTTNIQLLQQGATFGRRP